LQWSVLEVLQANVLSFQGSCAKNITLNRPICRATHHGMEMERKNAQTVLYRTGKAEQADRQKKSQKRFL